MIAPLAAMYHFSALTYHTCGSPQGQAIIQSCILGVAMQTPYLMHAVLGVASAHMAYLLPADVNAFQHTRYKLADVYHWGQALRLFREELSDKGAQKDNVDALLSTIMLVTIYQFVLRDDNVRAAFGEQLTSEEKWMRSFVFIENEKERAEAMEWLTIQTGFKMLLTQLGRCLSHSVWMPVLQDAGAPRCQCTF